MRTKLLVAAVAALSLYGCTRDNQDWNSTPAAAASQPQVVQQQSNDNHWLWGLGGFLAGRMTAPSGNTTVYQPSPTVNNTTIVQRPVYTPPTVEKPLVQPQKPTVTPYVAPKPSYNPPKQSYSSPAPTYRPSFSSPSRSVTVRGR